MLNLAKIAHVRSVQLLTMMLQVTGLVIIKDIVVKKTNSTATAAVSVAVRSAAKPKPKILMVILLFHHFLTEALIRLLSAHILRTAITLQRQQMNMAL